MGRKLGKYFLGDCIKVMAEIEEDSTDAIVTDPPYLLGFMGKEFDKQNGAHTDPQKMQTWYETWAEEAYKILKPGAHIVAFGGTRTYHRMVCAFEDVGFEIRDSLHWFYGSGFPKSHNLKGESISWGTALKPAHEPIVLARKPLTGTVSQNVLEHGTGALNVDGCRVETGDNLNGGAYSGGVRPTSAMGLKGEAGGKSSILEEGGGRLPPEAYKQPSGRWPPNLLFTHDSRCANDCHPDCPVRALEEMSGKLSSGSRRAGDYVRLGYQGWDDGPMPAISGDTGTAARFFPCFRYQAKSSTRERNLGLPKGMKNKHPTVKPLELMRWLVRLVTPPGGIVLDPFLGSGTTSMAAVLEGFYFVGIEIDKGSMKIAKLRTRWAVRNRE